MAARSPPNQGAALPRSCSSRGAERMAWCSWLPLLGWGGLGVTPCCHPQQTRLVSSPGPPCLRPLGWVSSSCSGCRREAVLRMGRSQRLGSGCCGMR